MEGLNALSYTVLISAGVLFATWGYGCLKDAAGLLRGRKFKYASACAVLAIVPMGTLLWTLNNMGLI